MISILDREADERNTFFANKMKIKMLVRARLTWLGVFIGGPAKGRGQDRRLLLE